MPDRTSIPLDAAGPAEGPVHAGSPGGAQEEVRTGPFGPEATDGDRGADERFPQAPSPDPAGAGPPFPPIAAPPKPGEPVPSVPPALDEPASGDRRRWWTILFGRATSSCLVSCVFHTSLLLILALAMLAREPGAPGTSLIATIGAREALEGPVDPSHFAAERSPWQGASTDVVLVAPDELPDVDLPPEPSLGSSGGGEPGLLPPEVVRRAALPSGGGLEGRRPSARARLADEGGATRQSEDAVERGLRWLAAFQREDGSWCFDHNKGRTSGFAANPGTEPSTTAATGIALAAFLGAGYTHVEGPYQETVRRGLYYLRNKALTDPHGIDLREGTMYAQGLCAITLCEAYAMTGDPGLKAIAQGTLDFIDYAQDKAGGGWRYVPGQPGDTTVTGWKLMAIKSGQLARLETPSPSVAMVASFLDSVAGDDGALYGYRVAEPQPRRATTAIGLLCRMYTGWDRTRPGLQKGVAYLDKWGPSDDDMYYNYYATQVLRHWGGKPWQRWNPKMRDHLVRTQASEGFESGSWYFTGGRGDVGGRLYNTAMAVMILEVYYRYMPLYQQRAFEP